MVSLARGPQARALSAAAATVRCIAVERTRDDMRDKEVQHLSMSDRTVRFAASIGIPKYSGTTGR